MSVSKVPVVASGASPIQVSSKMPATSAKEEGLSIASIALPSIADKMVSIWPQSVMIAGIVAAVIGVAAAIFTSSVFAGIGFALLGVISIVGVFVAQNAFEGAALQNSIVQLGRQNTFLDQQTSRVELTAKQILEENTKLKSAQGALAKRAEELQRENQRVIQTNKDLEKTLQGLGVANRAITDSSVVLERKIAEMRQVLQSAKQILQTFLRRNVEFASHVGAFTSASAALGRTEDEIRGAVTDLDRITADEIPQLAVQLQLARDLSDHIHSHMREQNDSLQRLSVDYRAQVARLETSVATLTAANGSLEGIARGFAAREASIGLVSRAMDAARTGLTDLMPPIDAHIQAVSAERARIADEVAALTSAKDRMIAELSRLRVELQELIAAKGAELRALQEQIRSASASSASTRGLSAAAPS